MTWKIESTKLANHCGIKGCMCSHDVCVKGWIENPNRHDRKWWKKTIIRRKNADGEVITKDYWYEYVKPCGMCRKELWQILDESENEIAEIERRINIRNEQIKVKKQMAGDDD